jgi:hypothetical protein
MEMATARVVLVTCLALVGMMILASNNMEADDTYSYEIGNFWTYNLEMEADPMTLTGEVTFSIDGIKTETVAGVTYDVYDMGLDGGFSITGDYLGTTIEGTSSYTGSYSVEIQEFDEIRSNTNLSMSITMEGGTLSEPYEYETWTHTVTTYSPPGGVGDEPDELTEGVNWVLTYTLHRETTESDDGVVSIESESYTETRTYTYIGRETVTVPAGTFDCEIVQVDDGDSIETSWICEDVGAEVKSVYESTDSDGVYVLKSYSYTPKSVDNEDMTLYIAIGGVVVVAAVASVLMLRRKRGKAAAATLPEQPSPESPLESVPAAE